MKVDGRRVIVRVGGFFFASKKTKQWFFVPGLKNKGSFGQRKFCLKKKQKFGKDTKKNTFRPSAETN